MRIVNIIDCFALFIWALPLIAFSAIAIPLASPGLMRLRSIFQVDLRIIRDFHTSSDHMIVWVIPQQEFSSGSQIRCETLNHA